MGVHVISLTLLDSGGSKKAVTYHCADSETIADIQTFVTGHAPKLAAAVGAQVLAASVQYSLALPGGLPAAADDYPVDNGALLGFSVTGTQYRHGIYVPSVLRAFLDNDRAVLDIGAMNTYQLSILSGEAAISLTNKHEQLLAAFLGGDGADRKTKR